MRSRVLVALQFVLIAALLWPAPGWRWQIATVVLVATGGALGLWALTANRPGNFNIRPDPKPGAAFVATGPYRFVRHPMYVAVLLASLGLVLAVPQGWRIGAFIALAAVLHVKAAIEETAMTALHPEYAAYRRRTARFVPFLW